MSDSSPLLLNMGAEVATATGLNPVAAQAPATAGNGNEFAGVLQSVLSVDPQQTRNQALLAKQIETNPLLFSQLAGSVNPLLSEDMPGLEALLDGNSLPDEGQELAWQTLLAEYDSTDPETPRGIMASGDENTYQLTEIDPDNFAAVMGAQEQANTQSPDPTELEQPFAAGNLEPADLSGQAEEVEPTTMAATAAATGQNTAAMARPITSAAEDEMVSSLTKLQQAGNQAASNRHLSATEAHQVDVQAEKLSAGKFEQLAGQATSVSSEPNHFEAELAASTDNAALKTPGSSTNSTTASMLGTSAYATVSGLGATGGASHPAGQVIANLTVPPHNPAWGDIVGDRVQWMAAQNIQEAKIRLNPPELGLLEVRVQVGHDQQTTISFSSPHSQVRDALETAVPRLREMFGDSGLTLGDVNVSHHSMSEQGHAGRDDNASPSGKNPITSNRETADLVSEQPLRISGSGMLDLYA